MTNRALAVALVPWLVGAALAEDAPAPSPRERTAKAVAAFPAPDAKAGFSYEMDVVQGGTPLGTALLSAAPSEHDGKPAWKVEETVDMPAEGFKRTISAWLSPSLALLKATQTDSKQGATHVVRTEGKFTIVVGAGDAAVRRTVDAPEGTTATAPALVLFLRLVPPEAAAYSVPVLRWDDEESALQEARVDVPAPPAAGAAPAPIAVAVKRGETEFTVDLDPADRSLLGIRRGEIAFVRKGLAKPSAPPAAPAPAAPASAKEAVARMAVAWAKGDLSAFAALLHWPTLHAASGSKQSLDEFRAAQEAALRGKMPEPDAEADARIARAMEKATEKAGADGAVEVTADFGRGEVTTAAREVDGRWYVVRLPR